jgi:hypothetical protein
MHHATRLLVVLGFLASLPGRTRAENVILAGPGPGWSGAPVSMDLRDAELTSFFQLIRDVSGLNIVLDPSVKGKTITLRLDLVPWDQALDVVLETHGLGGELERNVLRVAPLSKLQAEAQQAHRFREARVESGDMVTTAYGLSHADAKVAAQLVKGSLSPRGSVVVDERSNTLIVRDVARHAAEAETILSVFDPAGVVPNRPKPPKDLPPELRLTVDVKLYELAAPVTGRLDDAALQAAQLVAGARVLLGVEEKTEVALRPPLGGELDEARITISPQLDAGKPVVTVRVQPVAGDAEGLVQAAYGPAGQRQSVVLGRYAVVVDPAR